MSVRPSCSERSTGFTNESNNFPIDANQFAYDFDFFASGFNRIVLWVLRPQHYPIGATIEALQCGVRLMDPGHYNLPIFRRALLSNQREVSRQDVCILHTVALHAQQKYLVIPGPISWQRHRTFEILLGQDRQSSLNTTYDR